MRKFKRVLVESYVGAIGLGYLLAQIVLHFANIFASPVEIWITRVELWTGGPRAAVLHPAASPSSLAFALPELVRFVVLLLIWFALLYWLYLRPESAESVAPAPKAGLAD